MHKSVQPSLFKKLSAINSLLSALKSEPAIEEMKRMASLRKVQEWQSEELLRYNLCGVNPRGCDHICFFDEQSKDIKRSSSWTIIHKFMRSPWWNSIFPPISWTSWANIDIVDLCMPAFRLFISQNSTLSDRQHVCIEDMSIVQIYFGQ